LTNIILEGGNLTGKQVLYAALIDSLIDWCLTVRHHRKVDLCHLRGEKLAQAAKDGQRHTIYNALGYTITM